ncbi:HAD family hydrolase [Collinsella intestinalis]|uniref:HAD family hydrolase n=1 Tax=Collinsella intestinalis TaxID=147207 RepID=UPI0015FCD457|nr:HAD family phosphatase [Collinsella intestinalis]
MDQSIPFPFDAVIFDMDGVLVDTEFAFMLEERSFFDAHCIEVSDEELFATVGCSQQDFLSDLVRWLASVDIELDREGALGFYNNWASDLTVDYASLRNPGVPEVLQELTNRGVRLALASSSPMDNIRHVLTACEIGDYFEVVVSGEQFAQSKPDPEIYLHTLDLLGLPASRCCCVEDSVPGITAGQAAGLTVFAKREERFGFSQDDADVIIDQVFDLISAASTCRNGIEWE